MRKQALFVARLARILEEVIGKAKTEGKSLGFEEVINEAIGLYNGRYPKVPVDTPLKRKRLSETATGLMQGIVDREKERASLAALLF